MIKNFANVKTPTTGDNWIALDQNKKIDLVMNELRKDQNFKNFHVSEALDNGQIVFVVKETIPSNIRGLLLLDLEKKLKDNIDNGLTVWLEPFGDKSKLRNLRGVKIKKMES
jgi:hypothetical protein